MTHILCFGLGLYRSRTAYWLLFGGRHTHRHFFIPLWPLFAFPTPILSFSSCLKVFPALQHILHHFLAVFFAFPFSPSMELKHKGLALVKFTLNRIPPPSRPQPLCHHTIPVTLLFLIGMKSVRWPMLYCRLHCSYKQSAFYQCNKKTWQTQAYWIVNVWFTWHC